ncbi:acyl carrier protein [Azospirillum picis]|uniref:Acyl carrier protein n=1 Tax=Azospirillum picis TaxID=488438 RepID=A0ABU0MJM7_9PROT|nr:acyl carrier protein [Azospirillum picis]MBP2299869.1 acyl carrier protein [Azospirillum picis]MDQ0533665.1 acyl carrier protein [Azospirillum picis]
MPQDVSQPFTSSIDGSPAGGLARSASGGADDEMISGIRSVLAECGGLAVDAGTLAVDDDLYAAGLTSHGCVGLMLGLEEQFDVEFPEKLLNRRTFESIAAIRNAVCGLLDGGEA